MSVLRLLNKQAQSIKKEAGYREDVVEQVMGKNAEKLLGLQEKKDDSNLE